MPCHWRAILTKPCLQGLIDDLLEGFKKLQALGGVSATNGLNTASEERLNVHDIPSNHFLGMKIATAAITRLDQSKQPLSTRVMAEALERGGFRHTSQNFVNAVNTALYRLSRSDDPAIVKVGREWGRVTGIGAGDVERVAKKNQ
jgi:hypothetical protein